MKKATLHLEPLACPSCLQKIESATKRLDGVESDSVNVLFNSSKVKLHFNPDAISLDAIEQAIQDLGYPVTKSKATDL